MTTAALLHLLSTVLLAIGFLGVGAFMADSLYGPAGGGANIGLGVLMPLCLGSGLAGLGLGVAAIVAAWTAARRARRP